MSQRFELRHLGRDVTVEVREQDLVAGAQTLRFDAIREVRVARIGTLEVCALRLDGGGEYTFATDEAPRRAAFAGAVGGARGATGPVRRGLVADGGHHRGDRRPRPLSSAAELDAVLPRG